MRIAGIDSERVLVVGAGLTGASVARHLVRRDVAFDLVDDAGVGDELASLVTRGRLHERLEPALAARQSLIVLSPGVPRAHPAIRAALEAGVRVVGDVELFASEARAPVIAVTGSNGKSTVVAWLTHVLEACGLRAVACGNIGRPALDALDASIDCYVLEVSSYQLESTESLAPAVATVLNVSADHLDRYPSLADYARVKRRVYRAARHRVVNADDPESRPRGDGAAAAPTARFTLRAIEARDASAPAETGDGAPLWHLARGADGRLWLCRDGERLLRRDALAPPGLHNAANALAVLALVAALESALGRALDGSRARRALAAFAGLPHRTELVGEADGVRWYNDSKGTNVDACLKAIEAMPGPVVLIAGGLAKGADFAPLGAQAARRLRAAVLIGRDRELIRAALAGACEIVLADSLEAAVARARELARPGDVVLLSPACSSFDMFSDYAERGRRFAARVAEVLAA